MADRDRHFDDVVADLLADRPAWGHDDRDRRLDAVRLEDVHGHVHVWGACGGDERVVFAFYTDELAFTADELAGLTVGQARELHRDRDVAWLRS